jgi:glycosyltransferase involved in cell wall biosynthesis
MRIGFDAKRAYHNFSGLGNYSRDIIRMLSAYYPDHQYRLYNPKKGRINFEPGSSATQVLPAGILGKLFSSVWRRKGIISQLKKDKLNLYHGLSNELPGGISKTGIPSVVTIHDLIFFKYPEWYKPADRIIHQKKAAQACREASHIIAISEQTKADIIEYLSVAESRISVIYQGCHPAFKKNYSETEKIAVTEKFKLPSSYLLSVGTIEPRKNLLTTVKSLLYHNLPLVVVGKKTAYYKEVLEFINANSLESRVHFLENVSMEELAIIYQLAFVFCYPSIYEGFGIPIIEALFSGTPVISNEEGCFREAGGIYSFYINKNDPGEMAEMIEQLQSDKGLYNSTVEEGLLYARRFNDNIIAKQMMDLYLQIKQQS